MSGGIFIRGFSIEIYPDFYSPNIIPALVGGCRNSIFEFFEFFSANNSLKSSKFSESKSKTWPVF